jgi:hypothetical protein
MPVKTITRDQYYQLIGLKTLAETYNQKLEDIIQAVANIVQARDANGEPDGYVMDTVYSAGISINGLLKQLEITIVDHLIKEGGDHVSTTANLES